jgi:iron(III) transport system permease protein
MLLTSIISWITVRTRIPGRSLLDAVTFLPITFPGIVLGVSLIWVYLTLPIPIYGTLWILLVAYITRYMPYGIRTVSSSMVQIHAELEEAAHISGASWLQTFGRIILPLLRPGLVAGWIYVVIVSMRELSSSILLYSSRSLILSVLIFDLWDGGQFTIVAALSVLMIVGLILLVVIAYGLGSRFGVRE